MAWNEENALTDLADKGANGNANQNASQSGQPGKPETASRDNALFHDAQDAKHAPPLQGYNPDANHNLIQPSSYRPDQKPDEAYLNTTAGATISSGAVQVAQGPINPLLSQGNPQVSQAAVAAGVGNPVNPLPVSVQSAGPVGAQQDDETGVDDLEWVNRAKRIIAGTHGDPHRQVQLLQQLSVVYLKERYGRSVHADEV